MKPYDIIVLENCSASNLHQRNYIIFGTQNKMKNQNAKKEITRERTFKIRMSNEEKEMWDKYANDLGINPSRMARNILMIEAKKNFISKGIEKATVSAYIKYLEVTNDKEMLERMKSE